ncbi:hypothetical protein BP5796_08865 [Coleophoma crateriformis]|uniref:Diaminopimelate epimerase-like protein n=1 Tax=Coleophoma crateriformis TaxID=565419 RepID=A0A3D8R2N1_9HELO|nr:hypothetical protein BP5796_08865 [Coleophoma crateriformis]
MDLSFTILNVFTSVPYAGKPLAIVHIPHSLSTLTPAQKLAIAQEFNHPATLFLSDLSPDATLAPIEIYTPTAPIPFASHAVLGAAFHLFRTRAHPHLRALVTIAGEIPIEAGEVLEIEGVEAEIPHAFHIYPRTAATPWPIVAIAQDMAFNLVELPDVAALANVSEGVTLAAAEEQDAPASVGTYYYVQPAVAHNVQQLRTRMFSRGEGGEKEDAATGRAAAALAGYLAVRDGAKFFQIMQGVEMGRESSIGVEVTTTADGRGVSRVVVTGGAVEVMMGSLTV